MPPRLLIFFIIFIFAFSPRCHYAYDLRIADADAFAFRHAISFRRRSPAFLSPRQLIFSFHYCMPFSFNITIFAIRHIAAYFAVIFAISRRLPLLTPLMPFHC